MMTFVTTLWEATATPLMSFGAVIGVFLIAMQMKLAEDLEGVTQGTTHHGIWGPARRLALWLKMLAWLWVVYYGTIRGWDPWPPIVAVMWSFNFYAVSRIMVLRTDLRDHAAGRRAVRYYDYTPATPRA